MNVATGCPIVRLAYCCLCVDMSSIASDASTLLMDEPEAAVECHSLLASCFYAVARHARPARVRQRRAGVDVFHWSSQDANGSQNHDDEVQHGVQWKVGDVIKHKKYGYTGMKLTSPDTSQVSIRTFAV